MDKERETATDDAREQREENRAAGIPLNRHDRRAAQKVARQIADVDRKIAKKLEDGGRADGEGR